MNIIDIKNLSFKYNKKSPLVIDNLSLTIKEGSITTILGLNGCGKTTLIKLICGLYRPTGGIILLDGKDVSKYSDYNRSKIVSYVAQLNSHINDYVVFDYLLCSLNNSLKFYERPNDIEREKVNSKLKELGLEKFKDKKLGELSGGERQLISICGALLQDTKIIVLDEPTSALDLPNQHMIINMLKKVAKEGKTIIISTHNPNHANELQSDVVLMKNGKILKKGTCQELITIENLAPVYGTNIKYASSLPHKTIV